MFGSVFSSSVASNPQHCDPMQREVSGATSQSQVDSQCLAGLWKAQLLTKGWSERAASVFALQWAPSTQKSYSRAWDNFKQHLDSVGISVVQAREEHVINYLETLARTLMRPRSTLTSVVAALGHFYRALQIKSPVMDNVHVFVRALTKLYTQQPLHHSTVFSPSLFRQLFSDWAGSSLSLEQRRMKAIVLLSTVLMLRPSDIAPKSLQVGPKGLTQ